MSGVTARLSCIKGEFSLDAAFDLPGAGITMVVGASGSGKTTLLRCLAGLEPCTGTLIVDGETWQDSAIRLPPERRGVGMVFQGANLLAHLDVAANLRYAKRRSRAGPFAWDDIVARTGVAPLLARRPASLSGGEAQRVALARALLSQPRLLLLDEPLSALGAEAKAELGEALATLLPGLAIPILYVTHDVDQAARVATRRLTLANGRVVAIERIGR